MAEYNYDEICRVVYVWARYVGTRDGSKEGKHYTRGELKELSRKIERFADDKYSFNDGFEKDQEEEDD